MVRIHGGDPSYVHSTDKRTIPYRDGYDMDKGLEVRFYFPVEKRNEVFTFVDWLVRNYQNFINTDDYNGYLCKESIHLYQRSKKSKNSQKEEKQCKEIQKKTQKKTENKPCCEIVNVKGNPVVQEMISLTKIIFNRFSRVARDKQDRKRTRDSSSTSSPPRTKRARTSRVVDIMKQIMNAGAMDEWVVIISPLLGASFKNMQQAERARNQVIHKFLSTRKDWSADDHEEALKSLFKPLINPLIPQQIRWGKRVIGG